MRLERVISIWNRGDSFFKVLAFVAVSCFVLVGCLIFVDVIMRYVFSAPIRGTSAITGLALVTLVALTIPYVQKEKGHIAIDFLVRKLSPKGKVVLENIIYCLSMGAVALLAWRTVIYALDLKERGFVITLFGISSFPFALLISAGLIMLFLLLVRDFLNNIVEGVKLNLGSRLWLLSFGVLVLMIVGMIFWMQLSPLPLGDFVPIFGVIGVVCAILFLLIGIPIAFGLILSSFLLSASVAGIPAAFTIIANSPYKILHTDVWAVIALFILMGYFISAAGFGRDLYNSAHKWLGHMRGGLAQATIGASTALAAVIGDTISAAVTFGAVAMPEMNRYKYDERLATGVICAGATLGAMIPPSVSLIIYGLLTGQSVGALLIAGILPGLLLAGSFMTYTYIACRRNPSLGPRGPATGFKEKVTSLNLTWPILALFVLVIGGIYVGIFTPNEGGGVGLAGALIIGLIMRRFSRQNLAESILAAGRLIGMLFFIVVTAHFLGYFIALADVRSILLSVLGVGAVPPIVTVIAMCVITLLLGMILDPIPVMMITVPMFFPIIMDLGFDPIWFGVIVVLLANLACITPPFAVTCFAFSGTTGIRIQTVFSGVIPYTATTIAVLALLLAVPQIATFLPSLA